MVEEEVAMVKTLMMMVVVGTTTFDCTYEAKAASIHALPAVSTVDGIEFRNSLDSDV